MVEKKNPDYSASAVMLTNPPQVEGLLRNLQNEQTELSQLKKQAEALIPDEIKARITSKEKSLEILLVDIRKAIDELGSFQDVDKGWYALKQRRESINYKPELTRQHLEAKLASLVIIESVDSKALDGLVKGGLVTPIQARECGEVKESFAYIIK